MSPTAPPAALVFENVRLFDPEAQTIAPGRLLLRDGRIAGRDTPGAEGAPEGGVTVDGGGAILSPGFVDMRVAIGEPGFEYRETIASCARAAAAGGVTTIGVLPNSRPAIDDPSLVRLLRSRGEETGLVTILPYGALTKGCDGEEMAELAMLREAGAIAFTDGTRAIADTKRMRQLLAYARGIGAIVVQHPEDPSLARGGCATAGPLATTLGLPQIPAAAEAILIARDIRLAEMTGARLHFSHVSTGEGLDLIRAAKMRGLAITCDTAPPYFALNEEEIRDYRTYAKLSPPLRCEADRLAVCAALADGTIDAIASDHTPWDADDKRLPFAQAAAGGTGLVTLLGVTLERVTAGDITLERALHLLTAGPAHLFGVAAGSLAQGQPGDLCLFDPEAEWTVHARELPGRAQNTPFDRRTLRGRVLGTWKAGLRVFEGAAS
ncbi:dihydroorotase [Acidomonas methanolica]|uniref:Dihydroorotase n=1 Tax=Acidomonas methanolica NBRC 104435 TaxID=1231351 RepID=A0A023D2Y7_ACIMT|nr:dihydroorotase [Acidomonas methanolica]MBU2654793.1 dihydroorotase [Acidomonas methanolica]TCS26458.1 dihydroorotase [Acidomonas methanolica]GAJ28439.1 dihydroorotase [Acidomonas methanolica NBRC 104435]GBQ51166.1 dihydroorotase [Acidomonas methanolica]GEK99206.1 dihydroorotase [Acidomonas methanolica NBRC 104435]